jgi:hypothetical protein
MPVAKMTVHQSQYLYLSSGMWILALEKDEWSLLPAHSTEVHTILDLFEDLSFFEFGIDVFKNWLNSASGNR